MRNHITFLPVLLITPIASSSALAQARPLSLVRSGGLEADDAWSLHQGAMVAGGRTGLGRAVRTGDVPTASARWRRCCRVRRVSRRRLESTRTAESCCRIGRDGSQSRSSRLPDFGGGPEAAAALGSATLGWGADDRLTGRLSTVRQTSGVSFQLAMTRSNASWKLTPR